jgi:hypothetical protein
MAGVRAGANGEARHETKSARGAATAAAAPAVAGRAWKSTDVYVLRYRVTDKRKAAVGSGGYKAQKG